MKQTLSIEQKIFRLLAARGKKQPQGHLAAIKRREILSYVRNYESKRGVYYFKIDPDRTLRNKIRAMQRKGYPIGSHSKYGYFVIKTRNDLRLSIEER